MIICICIPNRHCIVKRQVLNVGIKDYEKIQCQPSSRKSEVQKKATINENRFYKFRVFLRFKTGLMMPKKVVSYVL